MGFYAQVRSNFGIEAYNNLRTWARNNSKLASLRNRRIFLLQCKSNGLKPAHITNNVNCSLNIIKDGQSGKDVMNFNNKVIQKVLLLEIKYTIKSIVSMERESSRLWGSLEELLPIHLLNNFKHKQTINYNRQFNNIKTKNIRKLKLLETKQMSMIKSQDRWFKNISQRQIPERIASFLALGPKFSIEVPKKHVSIQKLLADVDLLITNSYEEEQQNVKRAMTTNAITNYLLKTPNITNFIQKMFFDCKKYLKENSDLLILQSDKGNVTVALDKVDYNKLSLELLNDIKYYKILNRDPTLTIQGKSNELVKNLGKKNYIEKSCEKTLYTYNAVPARFYGLPKIHKPTLSLRPIVSSINTPTSKISIFISKILTKSFNNTDDRYYIKDSFQFSELINNFQLPNNYVVVSFDVVSLYSNIPLDLVIEVIHNKWNSISNHTNIPEDEFVDLVKFVFDSNYFTYNNTFYSQIFGCPMGSNLSPIIARLVMDYVLDKILSTLPFEIPFIKKYVDDIICSIPTDMVDFTLRHFNGYNEHIQFTIETETNNSVPFLDTKLIRNDNNIIILDWYQKPMCSNRYIHFESNHPMKQKINLVIALRNRIKRISHHTLLEKNLNLLKNILKQNSYPINMINRLLYNTSFSVEDRQERSTNHETLQNNFNYYSMPIIGNLTSELISILKKDDLKIAQKNIFTIRSLFSSAKDPTPKDKKVDVVYMVPCSSCELVYVGQTSQQLKKRLSQHKSDIKNPSKKCALAEHCRKSKHLMKFEDTKILDLEKIPRKRSFIEMYHIKRNSNCMNSKSDIQNISNIYSFLIMYDHSSNAHEINSP